MTSYSNVSVGYLNFLVRNIYEGKNLGQKTTILLNSYHLLLHSYDSMHEKKTYTKMHVTFISLPIGSQNPTDFSTNPK